MVSRLVSRYDENDVFTLARTDLKREFPDLSQQLSDVLLFYLSAEAAKSLALLADIATKLEDANELSELASLRLQMLMDRSSKFLSTLSNIMKSISSTQDSIVQNLK